MLKKNIAKLLVFAMILSMLPFSAVTAGAANPRTTDNGYALISDSSVTVTGKSNDSRTLVKQSVGKGEPSNPYIFKYDTDTITNKNYVVVSDANKVTVKFNVNPNNACVYYLGTDTNNATFSENNKLTPTNGEVSSIIDVSFAKDKNEAEVKACFATYSVGEDTTYKTYYKLEFTAKKEASASYTIEMDTVSVKEEQEVTLNPTLKRNGTTITGATFDYTVTDSEYAKVENGRLTGLKAGNTTLKVEATYEGKKVATKDNVAVTVTAIGGYTIKFDTTPAYGKVDVKVDNAVVKSEETKVASGKKVTITATPKDSTVYALNMDTFGVYAVSDDTEAAKYKFEGNNAYTFTMPDCAVKITAEFKQISTKKQIHEVAVTMKPVTEVKTGFAIPKATSNTPGVKEEVEVTWTYLGTDGESAAEPITGEVFKKAGNYQYEFKAKPDTDYELASDVKYVLNGATEALPDAKGTLKVSERDELHAWWKFVRNVGSGQLTIENTDASMYYAIEVKQTSGGVPSAAYLVMKGGSQGKIEFPCSGESELRIWVTSDPNAETVNLGAARSLGKAKDLKQTTPSPAAENENQNIDSKENGAPVAFADISAVWKFVRNVGSGKLTISNADPSLYYAIEVKQTSGGVPSAAYLIMQSDADGKIEFPCSGASELRLWVTTDPTGATSNLGTARNLGVAKDIK